MPEARTDSRTDAELVRRGLARSRRQAVELVDAGRVLLDGRVVTKPSTPVPEGAPVTVRPDPDDPGYASRAGGKLAGALDALAADPAGQTLLRAVDEGWCLDAGASTGGFTDVLLRRGARHVVALDVGHDQLVPTLRDDPRVTVVEGFNLRDLTPPDLERAPDVVVGDLSFISLSLVLGPLAAVLGPQGHALLLVKPQFEVGRERLGSGGVVRDPALHAEAVRAVVRAAAAHGLRAAAVVPSPLPGPSGNREFFCWFQHAEGASPGPAEAVTDAAVAAAVAWRPGAPEAPPSVPPVLPIGGAP
ncbi:TlyA family RNA methyltransferase [Krasilnikoviella flava]|uniref:23S rRNA (Cytidine1920-2'-O)/16S rRNA (Cytidine1409-2'-O)-methyltransferase n=1 Tax=Krasilnikoviella flava TaxID=526729 RepID=A0A1T5M316_9MICO|nr:TlyA family RNA methyltransferase [Krasilnikoviella flava]SKC82414.1 23S rRNA (cytidine1920-2'-O)/16S rRNA (cytidine1409-2'-O)-methyltransferase [Krasilnikoviella flava]